MKYKVRKHKVTPLIILVLALVTPIRSFSDSIYKWQTPDGGQHISDLIPPSDVRYGYTVIDMSSGEKTVVPRELSPEEIKEKEALAANKEKEQRLAADKEKIQTQEDDAFLARFSSHADILRGLKKAMDLNQDEINTLKMKINALTGGNTPGNTPRDDQKIMASYQKEMLALQVARLAIPDEFNEKEERMNRLLHRSP